MMLKKNFTMSDSYLQKTLFMVLSLSGLLICTWKTFALGVKTASVS